jgi:hypothetical protein
VSNNFGEGVQKSFESLANRIHGLPAQFYLSCFISGLKPEIRREVLAFQPISLSHAISLAKLQEDKFADHGYRNPSTASSSKPPYKPPITASTTIKPPNGPKMPPPNKRLSPAKLQARRDAGLCYNCDDRFQPGHKCRRLFNLLIVAPPHEDEDSSALDQLLLTLDTPQILNPRYSPPLTRPK